MAKQWTATRWRPYARLLIGLALGACLLILLLPADGVLANDLGRFLHQAALEPTDFDLSVVADGDETFRNEGAFGSPVRYPEGVWSYSQPQQDPRQSLARSQYNLDDLQQQQPDLATIYFAPASQVPQTLSAESKLPTLAESLARLEALNKLKQSLSLQTQAASDSVPIELLPTIQQDPKLSLLTSYYSLGHSDSGQMTAEDLESLSLPTSPKRASNDATLQVSMGDDDTTLPVPTDGDERIEPESKAKTILTTLLEDEEQQPQQPLATNATVVDAAAKQLASLEAHDKVGLAVPAADPKQDELNSNYLGSLVGWIRDIVVGSGSWLANNLAENRRLNQTGHKLETKNHTITNSSERVLVPSKQVLEDNEGQPEQTKPSSSSASDTEVASGKSSITTPTTGEPTKGMETNDKTNEDGETMRVAKTASADQEQPAKNNNNNKRDPFERVLVGPADQQGQQRVSLFRQSTLGMPLDEAASDERLALAPAGDVGKQAAAPTGSLLGHYLYAPYNHLRAAAAGLQVASPSSDADDQALAADSAGLLRNSHLSSGRFMQQHQHRGNEIYPASYPASYGLARHPDDHISYFHAANQRNDIYFLIMVGTFCVMAMAVVLAAGLFAYRVQQNRKTTSDGTDYPTYGVVGPNNMSAKLGALGANIGAGHGHGNANLVGSYLASGGASSYLGSLAGASGKGSIGKQSQCHSPELYSPNDSGIGGPSSKKSSNNDMSLAAVATAGAAATAASAAGTTRNNFLAGNQNAARMYHYQHQKQQMIISDRTSTGRHTSASDLDSEEENEEGNYTVYECPGLASAHEMEIKNPLFNDDRSP